MSFDFVDVLNIAGRDKLVQDIQLSKLMYLMWYEHMKRKHDMGPKGIYGHINHELLANKYYEEFHKKIATWDVPNRDIKDIL